MTRLEASQMNEIAELRFCLDLAHGAVKRLQEIEPMRTTAIIIERIEKALGNPVPPPPAGVS